VTLLFGQISGTVKASEEAWQDATVLLQNQRAPFDGVLLPQSTYYEYQKDIEKFYKLKGYDHNGYVSCDDTPTLFKSDILNFVFGVVAGGSLVFVLSRH